MIDKSSLQAIVGGIVFLIMAPTIFGMINYASQFPNTEPGQGVQLLEQAILPWWLPVAGVSGVLFVGLIAFFVWLGLDDFL